VCGGTGDDGRWSWWTGQRKNKRRNKTEGRERMNGRTEARRREEEETDRKGRKKKERREVEMKGS
jgi:hypothetical protein